jgi:diadenosine tetraphosphate (Ap4A) HIT family hydrolase
LLTRTNQDDEGCPFCRIVSGKVSAEVLYETDIIVAFLDNRPVTPGHSLVVPRQHVQNLERLEPHVACQLFIVGRYVLRGLKSSGLRCEGVTVALADGEAAGQTVDHVHLHVVPRYTGDGYRVESLELQLSPEEMYLSAERLRSSLRSTPVDD